MPFCNATISSEGRAVIGRSARGREGRGWGSLDGLSGCGFSDSEAGIRCPRANARKADRAEPLFGVPLYGCRPKRSKAFLPTAPRGARP